jgi:hypothetical protein
MQIVWMMMKLVLKLIVNAVGIAVVEEYVKIQ